MTQETESKIQESGISTAELIVHFREKIAKQSNLQRNIERNIKIAKLYKYRANYRFLWPIICAIIEPITRYRANYAIALFCIICAKFLYKLL